MSATHNAPILPPHAVPSESSQYSAPPQHPDVSPQPNTTFPGHNGNTSSHVGGNGNQDRMAMDSEYENMTHTNANTASMPTHSREHAGIGNGSGTGASSGLANKVKKGANVVHGMGETLRGNLLATADEVGGDRVAGAQKRNTIVEHGENEIRRGMH